MLPYVWRIPVQGEGRPGAAALCLAGCERRWQRLRGRARRQRFPDCVNLRLGRGCLRISERCHKPALDGLDCFC
jgi:hypothetical protein